MEAGPIYTLGKSFRARAKARQRQYRSEILKAVVTKTGKQKSGSWRQHLDLQCGN